MTATYSQRLDEWAFRAGGTWRVWSVWEYVEPFERWLFWFGEAKNARGETIATVDRLRSAKPYGGQDRTTRLLWDAVATASGAS